MASKIITDNPKHHKYVIVNKYERKKLIKNIIFNFVNKVYNTYYLIRKITYSYKNYGTDAPYLGNNAIKNTKIIYDDCNHKSYRVIKNGKFIKTSPFPKYKYKEEIKHFKRNAIY